MSPKSFFQRIVNPGAYRVMNVSSVQVEMLLTLITPTFHRLKKEVNVTPGLNLLVD